jgi:hypothetical protein
VNVPVEFEVAETVKVGRNVCCGLATLNVMVEGGNNFNVPLADVPL